MKCGEMVEQRNPSLHCGSHSSPSPELTREGCWRLSSLQVQSKTKQEQHKRTKYISSLLSGSFPAISYPSPKQKSDTFPSPIAVQFSSRWA